MSALTVQPEAPGAVPGQLNDICVLYDRVFSQPPFRWTPDESEHHRSSLLRLEEDPNFGLVTARDADGRLRGFAYGVALGPDTRWWEGFKEPLPPSFIREWEGRTFAIIDVALDGQLRGHGDGRRLVETLLATRREERATLTVQPTAEDAKAFYDHLGWQNVGRKEGRTDAVSPVWDVYVTDLPIKP